MSTPQETIAAAPELPSWAREPAALPPPPLPSAGGGMSRIDMEIARVRHYPRPQTGVRRMGIFSRTRDIIAANITDMLDRAEDPAKMIRLIILEMEETLVEVRASAARTIADQKEMRRHIAKLERFQADWAEKAQLALSKDREDLARAALVERQKASDLIAQLEREIATLDDSMHAYEDDIDKLQNRLREARTRQRSIVARLESAEHRVRMRTLMSSERVGAAMARFEQLERRVDHAEGRAESLRLGDVPQASLADEIAALETNDRVDRELEAMKRKFGNHPAPDEAAPDEQA
jgi:phage shock protein A